MMLIEVGGVDNMLDELYNIIDVLIEVFSKYYWNDVEKVNGWGMGDCFFFILEF